MNSNRDESFQDEIVQMIVDCENRDDQLTGWEIGFLASLSDQLPENELSEKQIEKLEQIWDRVTSR